MKEVSRFVKLYLLQCNIQKKIDSQIDLTFKCSLSLLQQLFVGGCFASAKKSFILITIKK